MLLVRIVVAYFAVSVWVLGFATVPGYLFQTQEAMNGNHDVLIVWWAFPLIAIAFCIGIRVLANFLPLIMRLFANGFRTGAVVGLVVAWLLPEDQGLYFLASGVSLLIAWQGTEGVLSRAHLTRVWNLGRSDPRPLSG